MRATKQMKYLLVGILIVTITVGYAFLNTTLSIRGTTKIDSNTWDVRFSRITSEVVTGRASITTPAEIITTTSTNDTVVFNVNLSKPGDSYKLTVYRQNAGTIDAYLDSYTVEGLEGTEGYLKLDIDDPLAEEGYEGDATGYGNLLSKRDLLASAENYIIVTLKYKEDITEEQLLSAPVTKEIAIKMNYVQKTN